MSRFQDEYNRLILQAIASGRPVTQRALSQELGVALGLTNLLIRRLIGKGYVKVSNIGTRHVRYLMTPAGWEALAVATRLSLENTIHLYTETREQIQLTLERVSLNCVTRGDGCKPVAFYGAGDVAEIAYVSLQRTDLTLVGIVDDQRAGRFFHLSICPPDALLLDTVGGVSYSHLVVTTIRHADRIRTQLEALGVPDRCISYL